MAQEIKTHRDHPASMEERINNAFATAEVRKQTAL